MMQLVDSHCHLDFPIFDNDRAEVLNECAGLGIETIIVPAVTADTWPRLLKACESSSMLHYALGLHPMFMNEHQAEHTQQLHDLIANTRPVAVGEIGLDFFVDGHDKQAQIDLFEQQLIIAKHYDLPVILHIRKAYDQALSLLKKHNITKGIVHAFSGSEQQAQHFIKHGFLLGIGGVITYDKATKLRRLFSQLPLTHVVLETDAPDMPLHNTDLSRNSPSQIPRILATLADIRNESADSIAKATTANVNSLFFR
jgi:TatD DNase family protein